MSPAVLGRSVFLGLGSLIVLRLIACPHPLSSAELALLQPLVACWPPLLWIITKNGNTKI